MKWDRGSSSFSSSFVSTGRREALCGFLRCMFLEKEEKLCTAYCARPFMFVLYAPLDLIGRSKFDARSLRMLLGDGIHKCHGERVQWGVDW